jgi:transcriptional regulator GlxA family with amidase domain
LSAKQRELVHRVEHVLSERWDQGVRLSSLAAEVGISVFHLCRTFRRATGMTLHAYRHGERLRRSLEAVTESRKPLVDIALGLGFSSHSHFTDSFHREFDRTPSALRTDRRVRA